MVPAPERTVVLYDRDCGFCRWIVDRLLDWDRHGLLRAAPIQSDEAERSLHDVPAERRLASMHSVGRDGLVRSGGAAIAPILRELPFGRPVARLAETFPKLTERLYRFLAEHRAEFAGIVGARACAVDPQRPRV